MTPRSATAFEELERLIETLDPPGDAAMSRSRRLVLRATSSVPHSFELVGAIYAFEVAFDGLALSHEFDADRDHDYARNHAKQKLRELRGVVRRSAPRMH